jgi:hypothetical protein
MPKAFSKPLSYGHIVQASVKLWTNNVCVLYAELNAWKPLVRCQEPSNSMHWSHDVFCHRVSLKKRSICIIMARLSVSQFPYILLNLSLMHSDCWSSAVFVYHCSTRLIVIDRLSYFRVPVSGYICHEAGLLVVAETASHSIFVPYPYPYSYWVFTWRVRGSWVPIATASDIFGSVLPALLPGSVLPALLPVLGNPNFSFIVLSVWL